MQIDENRLNEYLKRFETTVCPLCKHNIWTVSSTVFQAIEFGEKYSLGDTTYPMIALTCVNCGNTFFINTMVSGLMEDKVSSRKSESNGNIE